MRPWGRVSFERASIIYGLLELICLLPGGWKFCNIIQEGPVFELSSSWGCSSTSPRTCSWRHQDLCSIPKQCVISSFAICPFWQYSCFILVQKKQGNYFVFSVLTCNWWSLDGEIYYQTRLPPAGIPLVSFQAYYIIYCIYVMVHLHNWLLCIITGFYT